MPGWAHGYGEKGTHEGSKALLGAIRHKHPRLVCGHVHEGHGVSMAGGPAGAQTLVANVCARNWDYQVSHPEPMQFLIPPRPGAVEVLR
jgi:hypothetical protein